MPKEHQWKEVNQTSNNWSVLFICYSTFILVNTFHSSCRMPPGYTQYNWHAQGLLLQDKSSCCIFHADIRSNKCLKNNMNLVCNFCTSAAGSGGLVLESLPWQHLVKMLTTANGIKGTGFPRSSQCNQWTPAALCPSATQDKRGRKQQLGLINLPCIFSPSFYSLYMPGLQSQHLLGIQAAGRLLVTKEPLSTSR